MVPVVASVMVLTLLFDFLDGLLGRYIWQVRDQYLPKFPTVPGVGLIATLLVIYLAGVITTNVLGRQIVHALDGFFARLPVIRNVYSAIKQLIHSVSQGEKGSFQRVVLVEFPTAGTWTVGFVTGDLKDLAGKTYLSVFVATAPNPTTGYALVVPVERAIESPMSVEEAFKFLLSGGVIRPPKLANVAISDCGSGSPKAKTKKTQAKP